MAAAKRQYSRSYDGSPVSGVWRPGPTPLQSGTLSYTMVHNFWPHAQSRGSPTRARSAPNSPMMALRSCASQPVLSLVQASWHSSSTGSSRRPSTAGSDMSGSSHGLGISRSAPIPIPGSEAVDEKPYAFGFDIPSFTLGHPLEEVEEVPEKRVDALVDSEHTGGGQEEKQLGTPDHPWASKQAPPGDGPVGPVIVINRVDTFSAEPVPEAEDKYLQASTHAAPPHTTSHTQPNQVSHKMPCRFIGTDVVHETVVDGKIVSSETWNKGKLLGVGGQGKVYKQESKTEPSRFRAVKEIPKMSIKNKGREVSTMLSVKEHSEIFVQFFGWYEDDDSMYIAMEYIPHGDLSDYVKNHRGPAQEQAKTIVKQVLQGLHVLHNKKICHRDLKPPNVLVASIDPLRLKLADFGISKGTVGTDLRTQSGTLRYMAPELQGLGTRRSSRRPYTIAVDMWALGVIVYELLTSRHPFQYQENTTFPESVNSFGVSTMNQTQSCGVEIDPSLFRDFCEGGVPLPLDPALSERAKDFIGKVLVADAKRRMSASAALGHEWISGDE